MEPQRLGASRNTLIGALEPHAPGQVAEHFERVSLDNGELIVAAGKRIAHAFFPESAVTSVLDVLADGSRIEIAIVGFEGMAGWPAILRSEVSPHDVRVQGYGGTALRIEMPVLLDLCVAHPDMCGVLLRYVNAFVVQVGRTAVSNLRDPVERRLSRWLLMCHDRLEGDEIDLTHKTIATMLGMRRASVTDGLNALEGGSMIRNRRGRIVIRDRGELRRMAGDGYGHSEAHYSQTIAPFGK